MKRELFHTFIWFLSEEQLDEVVGLSPQPDLDVSLSELFKTSAVAPVALGIRVKMSSEFDGTHLVTYPSTSVKAVDSISMNILTEFGFLTVGSLHPEVSDEIIRLSPFRLVIWDTSY